jgi:hypothetical protein
VSSVSAGCKGNDNGCYGESSLEGVETHRPLSKQMTKCIQNQGFIFYWLYNTPWALASAFQFNDLMIILQTAGLFG